MIHSKPSIPLTIREREIFAGRRNGETSVDRLRQAIDDVRAIDNSEIDLDPASDRVLLHQPKRWWQPWKKAQLVEYTVRAEDEYGLREVIVNPEYSGSADINEVKLNGCNIEKKEWVDLDSYWMNTDYRSTDSPPLSLHHRAAGPHGTNRPVNHTPQSERRLADLLSSESPLLKQMVERPQTDLNQWASELKKRKPSEGWSAPDHTPLQGPICRLEDSQTLEQRLQRVALQEHHRFGEQRAEEVDGKVKMVKQGYPENARSQYRRVQRYWRGMGQNHSGLERDKDWSGAFLNFAMEEVGLESPLRKSENAFFQYVIGQRWNHDHEIHSTAESKPQLGNLLVHSKNGRTDLRWNPEEIDAGLELITGVGRDYVEVTSGDFEDSVTTRRLELDYQGRIRNRDRYFALIDLNLELDQ